MFNIFKKEESSLVAPVSGRLIKLTDVKDEVFASGMMGEGVAIDPTENLFVAPADGEIILIAETNHAFGMRLKNGIEILVHIGLDTALYKGEGFHVLVKEGDIVSKGAPLIEVDLDFFKELNCILQTPVIVLNNNGKKCIFNTENIHCQAGETKIIKF